MDRVILLVHTSGEINLNIIKEKTKKFQRKLINEYVHSKKLRGENEL